jgi:ribonuclease HII
MLKSFFHPELIEAGCDEAGRGCLAGPVVAAAVILPKDYQHLILNDSKQLSEKKRNQLRIEIEKEAIAWAVAEVSNQEIDEINILNASYKAMHLAIAQLKVKPELLLIDGNRFKPYQNVTHECIVKGDSKYFSIAAASILAKTYRDDLMYNLSQEFPDYEWRKNKGYPTKIHCNRLIQLGPSPFHRKSFQLKAKQLRIFD